MFEFIIFKYKLCIQWHNMLKRTNFRKKNKMKQKSEIVKFLKVVIFSSNKQHDARRGFPSIEQCAVLLILPHSSLADIKHTFFLQKLTYVQKPFHFLNLYYCKKIIYYSICYDS